MLVVVASALSVVLPPTSTTVMAQSPPVITSISPSSGSSAGGTLVTISGSGLSGASAVTFGDFPTRAVTEVSDSQIQVVTPASSGGEVKVVVTTPHGTSEPATFVYEDGLWRVAQESPIGRYGHTATVLKGPGCGDKCGMVLVAGGCEIWSIPGVEECSDLDFAQQTTASAHLFNPIKGEWQATTPMNRMRAWHSATLLSGSKCEVQPYPEWCGKVLVAGGWPDMSLAEATGEPNFWLDHSSAELYDPATGKWSMLGEGACEDAGPGCPAPMIHSRLTHTATQITGSPLLCGAICDRVLVAGNWRPHSRLSHARVPGMGAAATFLTELYNPDTGRWEPGGSFVNSRSFHALVQLRLDSADLCGKLCGKLIAIGGSSQLGPLLVPPNDSVLGTFVAPPEIYDAVSRTWLPTSEDMLYPRGLHTATVMSARECEEGNSPGWCGDVLAVGGYHGGRLGTDVQTKRCCSEVFDPLTGTWATPRLLPGDPRMGQTATLLPDGSVLVAGGIAELLPGSDWRKREMPRDTYVYDPRTSYWRPAGSMTVGRGVLCCTLPPRLGTGPTATLLPTGPLTRCVPNCGKVLMAGGFDRTPYDPEALWLGPAVTTTELYVPVPTLHSILPQTGPTSGHTPITIEGTGFMPGLTTVQFGDSPPMSCDDSSSQCRVESYYRLIVQPPPVSEGGTVDVKVTTEGGAALKKDAFTYLGVPGAIADLTATATSPTEIQLRFDAPAANGSDPEPATSFVIKQSTNPITDDASFDAARSLCEPGCSFRPGAIGDGLDFVVSDLLPDTTYFYAIKARNDQNGLLGPISRVAEATTHGMDPGAVRDLVARPRSATSVELEFAAPGANGIGPPPATRYVIKQSRVEVAGEQDFGGMSSLCSSYCSFSPVAVGDRVTFTVTDLEPETTYYYALRADDEAGRAGPISNIARVTTRSLNPARVEDLSATALSSSEVKLEFSAPGLDAGDPPPARSYVIKQSKEPIIDSQSFGAARSFCGGACDFSPRKVGDPISLRITDLDPGTTYYYAVRALTGTDAGDLSNVAVATTQGPGKSRVRYPAGYSLVGVPAGTRFPATALFGWMNMGAKGRYLLERQGPSSGHGYWVYFPAPRTVQLGSGKARETFALGAYRASMVGNPSGKRPAVVTGHDFLARWNPRLNKGRGGYSLSGYREPVRLSVGEGAWVFSFRATTVTIRAGR